VFLKGFLTLGRNRLFSNPFLSIGTYLIVGLTATYLHTSPQSQHLLNNSSILTSYCWLILCVGLPIGGQSRPSCILFLSFFALLHSIPQTMGPCPPTRSTRAPPTLIHPIYHGRQPLVGCCELLLNSSHLRPRPQPFLYFSMGLVLVPQSMKSAMARVHRRTRACYRPIGSKSAKIWGRGR
jgi:hypothetical protein